MRKVWESPNDDDEPAFDFAILCLTPLSTIPLEGDIVVVRIANLPIPSAEFPAILAVVHTALWAMS